MTVFSAVCKRKTRRVCKSGRRPVNHFTHQSQRLHRSRTNTFQHQQIFKILRFIFSCQPKNITKLFHINITRQNLVMSRQNQTLEILHPFLGIGFGNINYSVSVLFRFGRCEIENIATINAGDSCVRLIDKRRHIFRQPMITSRSSVRIVHPLLNNRPIALVRQNKIMQIKLITILDSCVINLRRQLTATHQFVSVKTCGISNSQQFIRCVFGEFSFSSRNINSKRF